jgi:hypothetical protein
MSFLLGTFKPPINYGIQSPALGRGGPNMPADSFARHFNPWPPRWSATALSSFMYPFGSASSYRTIPQAPNLWTAFGFPVNNVSKANTNQQVF